MGNMHRKFCKVWTCGFYSTPTRWLGSRVDSVLDSSAEGPGFKSQPRRCRVKSSRKTVHTHRASVHQTAKLVAALLRAARVTAGLAESNGSIPLGLRLTSPTGWLPRTGISCGTLRSVIEYGLPLPLPQWRSVLMWWVCLYVCLSANISPELYIRPSCYLLSMLDLPFVMSSYVMNFRF